MPNIITMHKAVSTLLKDKFEISWQNAQVINDENGNPKVEFLNTNIKGIKQIDISISHCREYAVAMVIITTDWMAWIYDFYWYKYYELDYRKDF